MLRILYLITLAARGKSQVILWVSESSSYKGDSVRLCSAIEWRTSCFANSGKRNKRVGVFLSWGSLRGSRGFGIAFGESPSDRVAPNHSVIERCEDVIKGLERKR